MRLANQKQLSEERIADWDIPQEDLDQGFQPEFFGDCFNCGKAVTNYDFCYGCSQFVCEICNVNMEAYGNHNRMEHLVRVSAD